MFRLWIIKVQHADARKPSDMNVGHLGVRHGVTNVDTATSNDVNEV